VSVELPHLDLKLVASTFGLIFLAELGDKTQLSVITLVARHGTPWSIFVGAALGLVAVTALGAAFGQGVAALLPQDVLKKGAAALFVVMAALIWFDVL
jgi:putative Ca2+/H+ antiporter (TMEM165/GDT1 family)